MEKRERKDFFFNDFLCHKTSLYETVDRLEEMESSDCEDQEKTANHAEFKNRFFFKISFLQCSFNPFER